MRPGRSIKSLTGLAGGIGALAVDVLYLVAIEQQGVTQPGGRVVFVAGWIAAAGVVSAVGSFVPTPLRRAAMLGIGAAMLATLGVPAIFSIGVSLLLCAALVTVGATRAAALASLPVWLGLVAPILLIAVASIGVLIGFMATDL